MTSLIIRRSPYFGTMILVLANKDSIMPDRAPDPPTPPETAPPAKTATPTATLTPSRLAAVVQAKYILDVRRR
jgi:hypothetical protein